METTSIISTASIKWVYFQLTEKHPDSEEGADLNHPRDRRKPCHCTTSSGHSYPVPRSAFISCKLAPRELAVFQINTKCQHLPKALEQNNDDGIRKKEFIKSKLKITPHFTLEIGLSHCTLFGASLFKCNPLCREILPGTWVSNTALL